MVVLAFRVLLHPVSIVEISKADRAPHYARVYHVVSVSDDSHFLEHSLIETLLQKVNTKLPKGLHCYLVPFNVILNVKPSIFVDLLVCFIHLTAIKLP